MRDDLAQVLLCAPERGGRMLALEVGSASVQRLEWSISNAGAAVPPDSSYRSSVPGLLLELLHGTP